MSIKLPVVSAIEAIKAFNRAGFVLVSQKGSHVKMYNNITQRTVIIPRHSEISKTTLKSMLKQSSLSLEEFLEYL